MRTVRALFEREADAKSARERLRAHGVAPQRMSLIERQSGPGLAGEPAGGAAGRSLWASLKDMVALPEGSSDHFENRLTHGGFLLTASVEDEELEGIVAILAKMGVVDFSDGVAEGRGGEDGEFAPGASTEEERIPLVEEELRIGTSERDGDSVRVHAFATERPVHERVHLRSYRVRVDRRPVGEPLSPDASTDLLARLFSERSVELTETSEEVVFAKEARVREEVVVRKEAFERVEEVNETLRSTEVEVERRDRDRGAPGGR